MNYHAEDESTLFERTPVTSRKEAAHVMAGIQGHRSLPEWKKASIIAVVRYECVPKLRRKCTEYQNNQLTLRGKPPILVTSDTELRGAADDLARHPRCSRVWVIIVSGLVPQISFDIHANIDSLRIVRANEMDPKGTLLVSGQSTWNGTPLEEWLNNPPPLRFTRNRNVSILTTHFGSGLWSAMSSTSFGDDDRSKIKSNLEEISKSQTSDSWWKKIKGPIAAIAAISGLALGAYRVCTVLDCSAKGVFFSFECGLMAIKAGGFSVKLLAMLKVAAPPVAVGVGVASLVYFVPWDRFLPWLGGWLKRIFSGLWDNICNLWNQFWSMFLNWTGQQQKADCNCHRVGAFA